MTKAEKIAAVQALDPAKALEILTTIVVDCIHMGRPMLNSSEILDGICDTLKENGLDDGEGASEEEVDEALEVGDEGDG